MSTMNALTAVVLLTAMVITIPATTIQQAVATALEQNPQVKVAANAVRSAEARLTGARAALSPTASASVGASISGSDASTSSSGQARVGASYAVYDSGVREAQIRQAEAQAESSRQALAATQASVAVETGTAFMS